MKLKLSCDLSVLREQAKRRILDEAITKLKKVMVVDPAQSQIYAEKLNQAEIFVATGKADALLYDEAGIRDMRVEDLANCIIAKAAHDKRLRASIELQRSAVNAKIDAAMTPAQIDTASVVDWNTDG